MSWREVLAVSPVCLLAACEARADGVVINEVRYDPPGADSGGEYVELMNASSATVVLTGEWRLERGNGASPGAWTTFWTAGGIELTPGAWLTVGDDPRAMQEAVPGLQNGPDACRLVRAGDVQDLVGWGDHVFPEYVETAGAVDEPSGVLARRPDGRDTDDNARDFVNVSRETPGRLNFPHRLLSIETVLPVTDPAIPEPAEPFDVVFAVRSEGLEPLPASTSGVRLAGTDARWMLQAELPPDAVRNGRLRTSGRSAGNHELVLEPIGEGVTGEPAVLPLRIGTGDVVLSELQPRAHDDEPEWIEIDVASGAGGTSLGGWSVVDGGGGRAVLPDRLMPATPLVLTGERDRLLGRYPDVDPAGVWEVALPTLNDRDERLYLVTPDGALSDAVAFDAPEGGVSLERVDLHLASRDLAAWVPAPFGPTPQRPNGAHAEPPVSPTLTVTPRVLDRGGVEIAFHLGDEAGEVAIIVADTEGRERGRLLTRTGAARGGVRWDGRLSGEALPPGLYVLIARVRTPTRLIERRTAFAVGWGTP